MPANQVGVMVAAALLLCLVLFAVTQLSEMDSEVHGVDVIEPTSADTTEAVHSSDEEEAEESDEESDEEAAKKPSPAATRSSSAVRRRRPAPARS